MNRVIGLTGGIGSGKSTAAGMLAALGASVVDADEISRELTAPGGAALPALREAFGEAIVHPGGALDRAAMRSLAFSEIFEQGTLILDIIDGPERQIVWRGIAEAQVDRQRTPVERDKRIREAVAELLKKYPPKAKK